MPDEDKSADPVISEKAQAFKENLIRIVTVFAYASSVSMAALCLSSYYVFFWEPKPPGPGPPVIVPHANAYMAAEPYPPLKLVGLPPGEEEKDGASFWQSVWSYIKPGDSTTLPPTIVTFTTTKKYPTTPIEPYNFTALMSTRNNSSPGYPSVNINDILSIPGNSSAENEEHFQHDELEAQHEDDADDSKEIDVRDRKKMMSGYLGIIPDRRSKRGMETIHVKEDHEHDDNDNDDDDDVIPKLRQVVNMEDEEMETNNEERDEEEENDYFKEGIKQKEETNEFDLTKSGPSGGIVAQIDKEVTQKVVKDTGNFDTMMLMEGKPKRVEAIIGTKESERDTNEKITEEKEIRSTESTSRNNVAEKHEMKDMDETKLTLDEIDRYDDNNRNRGLESMILGEHVSDTTETILTKMEKLATNSTMSATTTRTIGTQSTAFKMLNTISSMITHTQKAEHKRELGTPSNMIQAKKEIFSDDKTTTQEVRRENKEETMATVTLKENAKQEDKLTTNSDMATINQNKLTKMPIVEQTTQGNKLKTVSDIKETVQMDVVALEQNRTIEINLKTKDDRVIGGQENTTKPSLTVIGQNKTQEESMSSTKPETVKDNVKTTDDKKDDAQDSTIESDLEQIAPQADRLRPEFTQYQHHQRQLRPRKRFPSA
uniref:Uncharacterized protein n=2 Tax=Cacopsylla melanoneura TaxID=428564 RepID=A0A8D8PT30_9HEMI